MEQSIRQRSTTLGTRKEHGFYKRCNRPVNLLCARRRQRAMLGFEFLLDVLERVQRPVEHGLVVGGHDARPQQRTAWLDGRVDRDVDVDAGVLQRPPQEHGLPVVLDQDGHDRRHRRLTADDPEAEGFESAAEVFAVVKHA